MDSLKLAPFIFDMVKELIDYKQYINGVDISYQHAKTYSNEYIRLSYTVLPNESYKSLSYRERQVLFQKTPHYTFSLSTNRERSDEKKTLLRILEFKHMYESLTAYVILQLESHLNAGASIKVKGIELWPEANYAEKYLLERNGAMEPAPSAGKKFPESVCQREKSIYGHRSSADQYVWDRAANTPLGPDQQQSSCYRKGS
jgi:hypothetical protein